MGQSALLTLSARYSQLNQRGEHPLPGLSVYRREAAGDIEAVVYDPVLCLILQGSKTTSAGSQDVLLQPGDALVVSHDMPVTSRITRASMSEPYTALIFSLDVAIVRGLYQELDAVPRAQQQVLPLSAGRAERAWVDPLTRYLELMENPRDQKVLGASLRREIHYRLLLSDLGGMLARLMIADSHASRVARAIATIRNNFRAPLSVTDLARVAGMSVSSFHTHFKSMTGTTPLQFQKDLRLIHARTQLVERAQSVAEVAHTVGYESATHFSRDYSRKFGRPPSRDALMSFALGNEDRPA